MTPVPRGRRRRSPLRREGGYRPYRGNQARPGREQPNPGRPAFAGKRGEATARITAVGANTTNTGAARALGIGAVLLITPLLLVIHKWPGYRPATAPRNGAGMMPGIRSRPLLAGHTSLPADSL